MPFFKFLNCDFDFLSLPLFNLFISHLSAVLEGGQTSLLDGFDIAGVV